MSFINRLERNIKQFEKNIEKEHEKIEKLRENCENHKITKGEFNVKNRHVEEKIRAMDFRMRILQGGGKFKEGAANNKTLQQDYKNELDPALRQQLFDQIQPLLQEYEVYQQHRIEAIVRSYGGVASDYECVDVLISDEPLVLSARYIEYNGNGFVFYPAQRYTINGSICTVLSPQWVSKNYTLNTDDITDFASLGNAEPMFFALRFISIQIHSLFQLIFFCGMKMKIRIMI